MKTKFTFVLLLLMFAVGSKSFAQVVINTAPTSYQPATLAQGGAAGMYKLDITNNNAAVLSGAKLIVTLPAGMEYVAGSITGATQSNVSNLQVPVFALGDVPSTNTLTVTFNARINCGFTNANINYNVLSSGNVSLQTAVSPIASSTPAPAYVFSGVPSPQALSTPLRTNATRTVKFKNSGNVSVSTVYFETSVVTGAQYPYYKLVSANFGTVIPITNGYRITLTGAALQSAITTTLGTADASFDKDEEITLVLTEQMTSCALASSIQLTMKAGSGDSNNSFCFADTSTASINTPASNAAISLSRIDGAAYGSFCTNGTVSYTIANTGSGAASSIYNIKLPWSVSSASSGNAPVANQIIIRKVSLNGTDITAQVLTQNGTGSSALIVGLSNCYVINLAGLTSAYGSALQNLDGDGKYDDLPAGQSFRLDFEYGFQIDKFATCRLNNEAYFNLGTSYYGQCGNITNRTNYPVGTDSTNPGFPVGSQSAETFAASLSVASLYPGDKVKLTTTSSVSISGAYAQANKMLKVFTIVLPDGLDYDSTGTIRYMNNATGIVIPGTAINYTVATKTLVISPAATLSGITAGNDVLQIPLVVASSGTVTNKTVQYNSTLAFVGCPTIVVPYACKSSTLNYAIIDGSCATVGTTAFDMVRNTFGYLPAPSGTNVWYMPTGFVNESTPNINLHGAVSKDKVKTTFKGIVNSTSYNELWARVKYTSNITSNLTLSNFDKLSANNNDMAGTITIIKAADGSTLSGNITVGDLIFSYDSGASKQIQQVNLSAKIGAGKDINYTLQVGDKIEVNWFTSVTRDNLSFTYSQLQNLEGDLYTKDAVGVESGCQAIPVGFSIQRLNVDANNNPGTQFIIGNNGLRITPSIINGNASSDISGDHFPNEVRDYSTFRSVQATLPGVWVVDTSPGKVWVSTSNAAPNYVIDPSKVLVTYSGGNTIVTLTNSPLGSNGLPLATATIPVVADNIGANGNKTVVISMLPVCAVAGSIPVAMVQSFDRYTTSADNSTRESDFQSTFNAAGSRTLINYTANTTATLQNVDGIGSTVKWQVRVSNTSDTAAIEAAGVDDPSLPNNWMSFVSPNNNITITKLEEIDVSNNVIATYPALSYGAGKYWVKLGNIATTNTYNVVATYTTCVDDKVNFTHGFSATGYPMDPDLGYGAELATCVANQTSFALNLLPKDISIDIQVTSPDNPVQFCTNPISGSEHMIDYGVEITNTGTGNAENLILEATFPANYTARAGTSKITHNGTTTTIGDPVLNTAKGVWQWYISADANGIPFLPPASTGKNVMTVSYQGETSCGYVSGSSVSYNMNATSGCGQLTQVSASGDGMDLSVVPPALNNYVLTPSVINLKNDGSGAVYSIEIKNQSSNPISTNENIYITLPSSIDYVAGSVERTIGAGNIIEPTANTVVGKTRIITFPLPTGASGNTLVQNETASFNIKFKIVDPAALSCGTIAEVIKLESIYSVPNVTCGASQCPVIFVTGINKSDAVITKTALGITPGTSIAKFVSIVNNDVTVKYTITNTGTIASYAPIVVDFFNDINKDGLYTTGEPILYTQTVTAGDATIASGGTSPEQTTAVFSMPESGICNVTAAIRLVNNNQVCADSATLIPINFEAAQTAFTVCGKTNVTIGNASNGATVSWSPNDGNLSALNISNPVFNYKGTPVTAPTDFVYTATVVHPGGCTNTYATTVTVNPDPVITITNPAPVCAGTSVDLSASAVTSGSAANLTYAYFTDADATVALVNYTAVTTAGTYYIKGTNANGCYYVVPVVVTVNPLPTASIGATAAVCKDDPTAPVVTFTGANGTAPYTFTYTINNGSNLTVSTVSGNSVNVSASTAAAGSFAYTLVSVKDSSSTACTQTQTGTATVTINPLPTATIEGTAGVCKDAASPNVTFTGAGGTAPYTFTYKVNNGADETVTTTSGNAVTVTAPTDTTGSFVYTLVSVKDASTTACTQAQTGSATITVHTLPTATIAADAPVCRGAASPNVTFTGADGTAPYTFTYKIDSGAEQTVTTTSGNSVTVAVPTGTAGDFVYTLVKVKDGVTTNCEQLQSGTATITINPLPTATIAGTTAVCKDAAAPDITFTGSGGTTPYTFTYKVNGGADQTISTTGGSVAMIEVPTDTAGTFTYTLVSVKDGSTSACTQVQTGTAAVTVNQLPTAAIAGTTAVCKDAAVPNVTLTGAGGTAPYTFTYNLNGGNNLTVTTSTGDSVDISVATGTAGTFTYNLVSVKDSNGSGCEQAQTGSAVVTVNAVPTAVIAGTATVCQNAASPNVTFTGAGGTAPYTFTYKLNGGADLTVTTTAGNSIDVAAATGTAGTFTYSLVSVKDSNGSGCEQTQTGSAAITVNPLPTASISAPAVICRNATANVTFTGAGGTAPYTFTYKLNGGADLTVTTTVGNSVDVAAATGTAGTFTYSLVSVKDNNGSGCEQAQTGSAVVTVNAVPTAVIAGTATVCQNAASPNVTFTGAGGTAPYTFTYKLNGGADLTVTTTAGNSVDVAAATGTAGTFTYSLVSVKDSNGSGCEQTQTGSAAITVNPLPTASISAPAVICRNATANVTFTGAGGTAPYTFTYKLNGGADLTVTTTAGNSVDVPVTTSATGTFTYSLVSVKDSNGSGCEQAQTGSAVISINENAAATISGSAEVCQNASKPNVTFTGSGGTAPYTFTYNVDGGANQTIVSTGDTATVAVETSTVGTITYNLVSVSDNSVTGCGQTQTGSAVVKINPLPTATIAGAVAICQNATSPNVTFTGAGGTAPYTFTYKVNGGADQTVTTTSGDAVTVAQATGTAGSFVYTLVSVKDASSTACTQAQTGTATITVNPLPTAAIAGTTAVCKDGTAPTVTFTGTGGTAPYTFTYKLNNGVDQTITTTSGNAVTVTQATGTAGSFVYTLISVKDASSTACTQTQTGTATITVNPLPTAAIAGTTAVCKDAAAPTVTFTGAGGTAPYTFTYKVNGGADQTVTTTSGDAVTVAQTTATVGDFVYTLVSVKDASSTACVQTQTGTATVTVNALLALNGTASTTCAADGSGYVLNFTVTGQAPYTVTGTGAPGTWSGNDWTSSPITAGTNYNVSVTDAYACNTVVVADTAPICCVYEVTAPTFPAATITCYDQMPTAVSLTKAEFEALGNGDGSIGNIPCGVIEITASNGAEPSCNGNVIRTYTVTEYADPNGNKVRDLGEDTVLNTTVITQTFTLQRADFVMPADQGTTVACISAVTAPVVPVVKDNCGNILTASAPVISAVPACNGVETYTYTFTDCAGHTHDWVYTYTIDNTVAPTGTAPADVTVQCIGDIPAANVNGILNVRGNCNNTVSVAVAETNNGGSGCKASPYIVTRTYTLTDCGGLQTQLVQTLTAVDTTAPVFAGTLPANITVECSAVIPAPVTLTATDNCSAATVSYVEVKVNGSCSGNYQLQRTWTASDACGNETKHTQVVQVVDTTAPVFVEALPAATINASCDTIPEAETLTATDACSNAFVTYTETKTAGDCSARYTLTRTWTASDECGNENVFTQTINVACLPNIFNGISPNGDGINDKFVIDGIDCFPNNTVRIYNRYGVQVYEKKGYDNVTNPFEGFSDGRTTVVRGDKLPTGTYFYTLEYDDSGKQVQRSGYLYISNQ